MIILWLASLFLGLQLVNHAVYLANCMASRAASQLLKSLDILGFHGLLARLYHHTTLDPHLDSFCDPERGAFGYKCRRELGISRTKDFVIKRLSHFVSAKEDRNVEAFAGRDLMIGYLPPIQLVIS